MRPRVEEAPGPRSPTSQTRGRESPKRRRSLALVRFRSPLGDAAALGGCSRPIGLFSVDEMRRGRTRSHFGPASVGPLSWYLRHGAKYSFSAIDDLFLKEAEFPDVLLGFTVFLSLSSLDIIAFIADFISRKTSDWMQVVLLRAVVHARPVHARPVHARTRFPFFYYKNPELM